MFISSKVCHLITLCFLNLYHALEQLPKDITPTEEIRHVVNNIFSSLKLKRKQDSKLSEYSTIHKHFVGLNQLESDSWKRLTKLTTADSKIDNGTTDLTTVINEILNEENNTVETNGTPNDDDVNVYVVNFLSTLARLKDIYLVKDSYSSINTEVLEHFYRNSISQNNYNHTGVDEFSSIENNNSTDELEFWTPTETRRIYRGKKTKIKHFPFLASVHMFDQFTCAGSLIQSSLVVTAASCLQLAYNNRFFRENPAFLAVRIGSPFFNAGGERIPVLEVYFYPTYSPRTLKDNIALMRLEKIVKFRRGKRNVKKIEIDRSDWNLPINSKGVTIAGWGAKTTNNKILDPWSNKVSMAHLPIYPLEECQDVYSKEYVTRKNFCAGFFSKGGGACNRDVGAPGVANGLLMGIASFGAPSCGTVDAPTVFTKVGYYYDWIETIMEQDVPHLKIRTTLRPYVIAQHVVPYVVKEPTQFKIAPIAMEDVKNVIDIRNLNRLRMDKEKGGEQNTKFENFLGTMFNSKDSKDHKDELPNLKTSDQRQKPKAEENNGKDANTINEELLTTPVAADEGNFDPVKFVTNIDAFDPDSISSREKDLDLSINLTELEKIAKADEVDNDPIDYKVEASEMNGKTTPILEEYGLSIELSDKSKEEKQRDISIYDNERKHQIEYSKYTNYSIKFTQSPSFQELNEFSKDISDKTLRDDLNHFNTKSKNKAEVLDGSFGDAPNTHQLNKNSQDQLKELEELLNEENESTEFNNEMAQMMKVPDEPSKNTLNTQFNTIQKLQRPAGASVKDLTANNTLVEKVPYQVMSLKQSKDSNADKPFNNHSSFQDEYSEESVKYKDVIDQLNKEHQNEAVEPQISNDQENEHDTVTRDTIQAYTQIYDERPRQVKELNQQAAGSYVPERHVEVRIQANKLHRLKQNRHVIKINDSTFKTEPIQQSDTKPQIEIREINPKQKKLRHQSKKSGKKIKELKDQAMTPDLSEGYANSNTEIEKLHRNQVIKRDDISLDFDVSPIINLGYQDDVQNAFERNARPKFNTKLIHEIEAQEKITEYDYKKDSKHQVTNEAVHNQLTNNSEDKIQKLNEPNNATIDKKLDEQIDQLLKNLDVENKMGSGLIENSNDKKVIEDDTLLTFLLMTDNGRNRNRTVDSDQELEYYGKEGITIDGEQYEDLTHRTNSVDDSHKIMSQSDMYDMLADAVHADVANAE